MTLKDLRKKYQGKYYRYGHYYYKFIRIFKNDYTEIYAANAECVNTITNDIDSSAIVLMYESRLTRFYERVTKSEYMRHRNKAAEHEHSYIISDTLSPEYFIPIEDMVNDMRIKLDNEIRIDSETSDRYIYYYPDITSAFYAPYTISETTDTVIR